MLAHLRSFTMVLVRFLPQKIPGYRKSTRGTGKVHTFFTVRCVLFGLPAVSQVLNDILNMEGFQNISSQVAKIMHFKFNKLIRHVK